MNCKNCGLSVSGNYCSNCGQKSSIEEMNFQSILSEVTENAFQINKVFIHTFKELFLNPEKCISEYLQGKRKKYFKPLTYLFTFSTIYFLISKLAADNTIINDFLFGFSESAYNSKNNVELPLIIEWFSANYAYASFFLLPLSSAASYLAFKNQGLNFLEHIVMNAFVTGQQAFIYSIFIILEAITKYEFIELISVIVSVSFVYMVYWKLFKKGNRVVNLLRSTLVYVFYLSAIFLMIILMVFVKFNL